MFPHFWASTGGQFCLNMLGKLNRTEPKSGIPNQCIESTGMNHDALNFSLHRKDVTNINKVTKESQEPLKQIQDLREFPVTDIESSYRVQGH